MQIDLKQWPSVVDILAEAVDAFPATELASLDAAFADLLGGFIDENSTVLEDDDTSTKKLKVHQATCATNILADEACTCAIE